MLRSCLPSTLQTQCLSQARMTRYLRFPFLQVSSLHASRPLKEVPETRPDIPDAGAFLKRIGRNAFKECEGKIRNWKNLFQADGRWLKNKDIPVRLRRYILLQTEKYRNGENIGEIRRGGRTKNKSRSKLKIQR